MHAFLRTTLVVVFASTGFAANASSLEVTKQDFGNNWPFTEDKATLSCFKDLLPVASINGKNYGLTGMAKSLGHIPLTPDTPIWRNNPETGAKVSLYAVSEKARSLCKK